MSCLGREGEVMTEDVYRKLQEHLHEHPMGYPATESGVEIDLLKKLFEKEEAEIALALTPTPESPKEIASKLSYDSKVMVEKLDQMTKKGLIMRKKKEGEAFYNLEPYVVGIYEFQLARLDKEFLNLHDKYRMEGLGLEVFGSETPYFRVIPVQRNIPTELVVFPHEQVSEIIEQADKIGVTNCICRTKANMEGTGCGKTVENCMIFSPYIDLYIDNGWPGRIISKEEAFDVLEQAEEEGLVHNTQNAATGQYFICNCCSDCCGIISAVKNFNLHTRVGRSDYFAKVDEELCTGCEECVERCNFNAISVEDDKAAINRDFCMGCGLCVSSCSTEALSLTRKPDDQIIQPPHDLSAMFDQIGKEKGRKVKVVVE
jgi:electron transport complex protein RnfB